MIIGEILGTIGSIGATSLVAKAAGSFIPENASKLARFGYFIGIVGLSGAAGDVAGSSVKKKVDDFGRIINLIKVANGSSKEENDVDSEEEDDESPSN